jgi:hypothetical protein
LSCSTSGSPWRTSNSFRNCVAMISRCLTDCLSVSLHPSSTSKPISQIINKISRPRRPVHHHHQPPNAAHDSERQTSAQTWVHSPLSSSPAKKQFSKKCITLHTKKHIPENHTLRISF